MCLGVPGKIVSIQEASDLTLLMGTVDFSGALLAVCLAYVPEARVGDHVLVHAGFALALLDEDLAAEKLAALRQLDELAHLDEMNQLEKATPSDRATHIKSNT